MPPIGETLRAARMRRELDIVDVEQRTKIRAKYLRALEHEEWNALPGPTYVRTFLRTYADVVGIDGQLLVDEYRANNDAGEIDFQPLAGPPAATRRDERRGRRRRQPGPPSQGVVFGVLVLAFVGLLLFLGLSADEDPSGDRGRRAAAPKRPAQDKRLRRIAPAAARQVTLRLAPAEPTYACVDSGAGTDVIYEGTLDSTRTFRSPRQLRINLGKRSVAIWANGRPIRVNESAEPYGLQLTRQGSKRIPTGSRPCA